jgi:hypothetical protein
MGLFSSAKLFAMTIRESATDGSDFTNPDADYRRLFLGEDGAMHLKDSSGNVTDVASGVGAAGDILGICTYAAGSDTTLGSTASTSLVDLDATNAKVTFTAPASGNVLIRVAVSLSANNGSYEYYLGLRESTSDIGTCLVGSGAAQQRRHAEFYLTGVSAGSHTYKLAAKVGNGATTVTAQTGPNYGRALMTVEQLA